MADHVPLESKLCDDHDSEYDRAAILDGWMGGHAVFMWIQIVPSRTIPFFLFQMNKKIVGV